MELHIESSLIRWSDHRLPDVFLERLDGTHSTYEYILHNATLLDLATLATVYDLIVKESSGKLYVSEYEVYFRT